MDKHNVTITRFDDHPTWSLAIMPKDRRWLLYVSAAGGAYLYERTQDTTDEHGDVRERYMLTGRPEGLLPAPASALVITISPTTDPESTEPFIAVSGSAAGMGKSPRDAAQALLEYLPWSDPALGEGVAALAL